MRVLLFHMDYILWKSKFRCCYIQAKKGIFSKTKGSFIRGEYVEYISIFGKMGIFSRNCLTGNRILVPVVKYSFYL